MESSTNQLTTSVIIPTKNGGEIFKKVLSEVLQQDYKNKFEVIIVDSGSTDGTVDFVIDTQRNNSNVILKKILPKEFGHGKTRNVGASLSNGDYIVFITQDALPFDKHWLENLVSVFEIDSQIMGVFGKHIPYDNCDIFEKHNIITHFNNFGTEMKIYWMDDPDRYQREEGYRHLLCFYSDNSSAMRKKIWDLIPYKDVNFAEDQLWAKEIIEKGYKKAYSPHSIVYHSHTYSFKQQFKRYFDEYKGLNAIYNYVPVKTFWLLPAYIMKHWISDIKYLRTTTLSRNRKIYWVGYSLIKNIIRYSAAYLGVKGKDYPSLNRFFSREYKIINKG
jgi:rhamnosyltransferase